MNPNQSNEYRLIMLGIAGVLTLAVLSSTVPMVETITNFLIGAALVLVVGGLITKWVVGEYRLNKEIRLANQENGVKK
jgi:uncharacterized membrane protein YcaP (DUF421 family)